MPPVDHTNIVNSHMSGFQLFGFYCSDHWKWGETWTSAEFAFSFFFRAKSGSTKSLPGRVVVLCVTAFYLEIGG